MHRPRVKIIKIFMIYFLWFISLIPLHMNNYINNRISITEGRLTRASRITLYVRNIFIVTRKVDHEQNEFSNFELCVRSPASTKSQFCQVTIFSHARAWETLSLHAHRYVTWRLQFYSPREWHNNETHINPDVRSIQILRSCWPHKPRMFHDGTHTVNQAEMG